MAEDRHGLRAQEQQTINYGGPRRRVAAPRAHAAELKGGEVNVKTKRAVIMGIESTPRKAQPYNIWKRGKIIFFARTLKEAETVLAGR